MQSYRQGSVHSTRAHVRMSFSSCAATFRPLQSHWQQLRWAHAAISPRDPGHTMRAHKRVSFLSSAATFQPLGPYNLIGSNPSGLAWAHAVVSSGVCALNAGPCEDVIQQLCCNLSALAIPSAETQVRLHGPMLLYECTTWAHLRSSFSSFTSNPGPLPWPLRYHRQ
jgi:hypothetical protein